jgi:hypothetical protein
MGEAMRAKMIVVGLVILAFVLMTGSAQAMNIFFWQHDNGVGVVDRVYNSTMTSTQSLTRTLGDLDLDYTLNRNLPSAEELAEYDVMMTSLSFYCPG